MNPNMESLYTHCMAVSKKWGSLFGSPCHKSLKFWVYARASDCWNLPCFTSYDEWQLPAAYELVVGWSRHVPTLTVAKETYVYIYTHMYIYLYIYIYTYTYTYRYIFLDLCKLSAASSPQKTPSALQRDPAYAVLCCSRCTSEYLHLCPYLYLVLAIYGTMPISISISAFCIYIHIYIHIYIYISIFISISISVSTSTSVSFCISMSICISISMCIYISIPLYTYIYTNTCAAPLQNPPFGALPMAHVRSDHSMRGFHRASGATSASAASTSPGGLGVLR